MKMINFLIFFSIVLMVYALTNYYIFIRGWQALPAHSPVRKVYLIVFIVFVTAFIIGRILEKLWLSPVSDLFVWIGSFWLAAMLYFFLIVFFLDLFRLMNHWIPLLKLSPEKYNRVKFITWGTSIFVVVVIVILGHLNAINPRVRTISLTIAKASPLQKLNIVAASDIHLGTIIGRKRFCKIVNKINNLNPDLILLPGDIVDEDLAPVVKENLGAALTSLKARYGVIAITGNHEYIGGVESATRYLAEHQVLVLRDSVIKINGGIYIVGREDRSGPQFGGKPRKTLAELMASVEREFPIILMDHQPFKLHEASQQGVDLQISGHTHHGQLWPLNYITAAIYEVSWGYKKIEKTHYYVSSGAGTWGPPVRTGNRPEIVNLILSFEPNTNVE